MNIQNNLVLSLLAGDVASFDIWYTPSKEGSIDSAIILHTISNPYETIKVSCRIFQLKWVYTYSGSHTRKEL